MDSHRRHDTSDRVWNRLKLYLPGRKGVLGRDGDAIKQVETSGNASSHSSKKESER